MIAILTSFYFDNKSIAMWFVKFNFNGAPSGIPFLIRLNLPVRVLKNTIGWLCEGKYMRPPFDAVRIADATKRNDVRYSDFSAASGSAAVAVSASAFAFTFAACRDAAICAVFNSAFVGAALLMALSFCAVLSIKVTRAEG